jgi:4-hydroxy-2-oxoheptanedioate aldolase
MRSQFQFVRGDGSPSFGGWCSMPGALPIEIMARSGFDWVCIDCQHGLIDFREMCSMITVAEACGLPVLVRVSWNSPNEIMRTLDAGASAIIVPMVNTAAEARAAASAARYAPEGSRSWGPIRALLSDGNFSPSGANKSPRCLVQVETVEAMSNLQQILDTDGVDGVYVGPADLALDHGMEPSFDVRTHKHRELVEKVLSAAQVAAVPAGLHTVEASSAREWADAGFSFITATSDVTLLKAGARAVARAVHGKTDGTQEIVGSSY